MPAGKDLKMAVEYMDSAMKFEILLTSFHAVMRNTCFCELALLFILAGFFLRSPGAMWYYFFHSVHLVRALIGFDIDAKVPQPQDFINILQKDAEQLQRSSFTFVEYATYVEAKLSETVIIVANKVKLPLKLFLVSTVVAVVLDSVDMII